MTNWSCRLCVQVIKLPSCNKVYYNLGPTFVIMTIIPIGNNNVALYSLSYLLRLWLNHPWGGPEARWTAGPIINPHSSHIQKYATKTEIMKASGQFPLRIQNSNSFLIFLLKTLWTSSSFYPASLSKWKKRGVDKKYWYAHLSKLFLYAESHKFDKQ